MPNYSRVEIGGHLGKDPELKYVGAKNTPLCNLTVAHSTGKDEYKKSHWHAVTVWGDHALSASTLSKGDGVEIKGSLEYEHWNDKDGNKRTSAVVVVRWDDQYVKLYEKERVPPPKSEIEEEEIPF